MPRYFIDFVSANCGAGKSHGACRYITENLREKNFLYVAPSLQLVSEIAERLKSMGVSPRVITSETHPNSVKRAAMEALKWAPDLGCCLLLTWQAFSELPFFPNRDEWQVVVDEIPQTDLFYKLKVPFNQRFITEWVEIDRAVNERVALLRAVDEATLRSFLNKPRDDVHGLFTNFLRDVVSRNKDVFAETASWTRVCEEQAVGERDDENTVFAVSLLNPALLDGAIMLGANFEKSMLHDWFRRYHGVRFEEFGPIKRQLRTVATSGREIRVHYFLDRTFFSKHKAKQAGDDGTAIIEAMDRGAASLFRGEPYLYVTNNDRHALSLEESPGCKRMKVGCHGLNRYDGFHNIYFSAALNREPRHLGLLRELGFDLAYVHEATTHEVIYQAVMRTSLRRNDAADPVTIIVPDSHAANRLQELIGATKVTKLGNVDKQHHKPLSGTERNKRLKATKLAQSLFAAKSLRTPLIDEQCHHIAAEIQIPSNPPACFVTFYENRYATREEDFFVHQFTPQDFIAQMRLFARTPIAKKERFLFIPARFDPSIDPAKGYRTQANFHSASMLVLDFDNGSLSPEKPRKSSWRCSGPRPAGARSALSSSATRFPARPMSRTGFGPSSSSRRRRAPLLNTRPCSTV